MPATNRDRAACPNCGAASHQEPVLCEGCAQEFEEVERARFTEIAALRDEVAAWRFRFPDLTFTTKVDGIQPKS